MKSSSPLSRSQYGIYIECVSHKGESFYNLPYIYKLDRALDEKRLLEAIKTAFMAHPTLFTRIELNDDGEPVQTLDMATEQWNLSVEPIRDIEQMKSQLVQPYDIYGDRLFHVRLLRDDNNYYLFLDYHHIIVDGTSMQVMLQDIDKAYHGEDIPAEQMTLMQAAQDEARQRLTPAFEQARR